MSLSARLSIDLGAVAANWQALDALSAPSVETAAVVKADAYGLGAAMVGPTLARAGAQTFFVALPDEGIALRRALAGAGYRDCIIYILGGYLTADRAAFEEASLRPVLNSLTQLAHWQDGPAGKAALQIDTGMNRLGIEPDDLATLNRLPANIALIMSHLACADTPSHPMNSDQSRAFTAMTAGLALPLSLAATGGTLLDPSFHHAMTRPGIGLYGGLPFRAAQPVVTLEATVIQVRDVQPGEIVGYGASWRATRPSRIATLSTGYADGLPRMAGNDAHGRAFATHAGCRLSYAGRVSMDLITLDVTDTPHLGEGSTVQLLDSEYTVDDLAAACGTIGYEILTSLGARYTRHYGGA